MIAMINAMNKIQGAVVCSQSVSQPTKRIARIVFPRSTNESTVQRIPTITDV